MKRRKRPEGKKSSKAGLGLVLGIGVGVALGVMTENLALWIAMSAALGLIIGAWMDGRSEE